MAELAPRGSPVIEVWTHRYRMVRGQKRRVKVRKVGDREEVLLLGVADKADKAPPEKQYARPETVDLLLGEFRHTLEEQFDAVEGLDRKAGVILSSASLVVALMTLAYGAFLQRALGPSSASACLRAGLVMGAIVYVRLMYCTVRAFRVATYYLPLKVDSQEIHNAYLALKKPEAAEQLLANYIEYCGINSAIIRDKAVWVQNSLCLLAADTAYLSILVIVGTLILA